ncbi:MAG: conjugative transfer ATPase [Halomonadaceae bacterium]|jgi:conjugative transfer ATPase
MGTFDRFLESLFPTGQQSRPTPTEPSAFQSSSGLLTDESGRPLTLPRGKPITRAALKKAYKRRPSFVDRLPWLEYLPESKTFLLEDGVSVGIVAEVTPIATEGREEADLDEIRDVIEGALQDSLPEYDRNPWVLQLYCTDSTDPREEIERLRAYPKPELADTPYTQHWLDMMEQHLRSIGKPEGLFTDNTVTQTVWRGQRRRVRLVLYRWLGAGKKGQTDRDGLTPEAAINHVYERLTTALAGTGLKFRRYDARDFHRWMVPRFNPRPEYAPDDPQRFYDAFDYPRDDERLPQYDLAQGLLASSPRVDAEKGLWYFDGLPHTVLAVEEMRRAPSIGHLTGEVSRAGGTSRNALMDMLPEGVEVCLTLVVTPQEPLEARIDDLRKSAQGDSVLADRVRKDCKKAREYLGDDHKLYQSSLVFLVRGNDERDLQSRLLKLTTHLTNAQLKPVRPEDTVAAHNAYLLWQPMAYDPDLDRKGYHRQMNFVQHFANLAPFWGRARGTGNPGWSYFNRGGEGFHFDPLNKLDRTQNAHLLMFGPTGAGKSATLNDALMQQMAMYKPRLVVIEKGNSFGLLGQHFERQGLSVNRVRLTPGAGTTLPPFAQAHRYLEEEGLVTANEWALDTAEIARELDTPAPLEEEDDTDRPEGDDEKRDLLKEMLTAARLMITGGEPKEEEVFRRSDISLVTTAITRAALATYKAGRQCLTGDVRDELYALSRDEDLPPAARQRAYDMGGALDVFCHGFDGEVFNSKGEAWPECDVTIIDLAHFSEEGYEAQLALSVIGVTNTVINIAERDQMSGRPIILCLDEAHLMMANILLSPYFVKVAKMGRKLGLWLWLATQNLEDYPDAAAKVLNMIEWWICLNMPPDEVAQVARFKTLSPAQRQLMLSAVKSPGQYTEGVVLAKKVEALFRIVPPSLALSLAGTEPHEKEERRKVMSELGISEYDAAVEIARRMDEKRGIVAQREAA